MRTDVGNDAGAIPAVSFANIQMYAGRAIAKNINPDASIPGVVYSPIEIAVLNVRIADSQSVSPMRTQRENSSMSRFASSGIRLL